MNYKLKIMKFKLSIVKQRSALANCQLSILLMIALFASPLKAQVTVGTQDDPHSFSLLELTTKVKEGGLRMPQLTSFQRDSISSEWSGSSEGAKLKGLWIYNLDNNCLEYWNETKWISLCDDVLYKNTIQLDIAGSNYQSVCKGAALVAITYSTTGATDATVTGLPEGITGIWVNNVLTISGTPTVVGTFNFTVILTGGSDSGIVAGTITVLNCSYV